MDTKKQGDTGKNFSNEDLNFAKINSNPFQQVFQILHRFRKSAQKDRKSQKDVKVQENAVPSAACGQMHRHQAQRLIDKQTDRQTDRQTNRQTDTQAHRHTDRQTDRQTDTQTDRHTQTHRHADRYTDRQTDILTH